MKWFTEIWRDFRIVYADDLFLRITIWVCIASCAMSLGFLIYYC